ncbi:hypothetical protein ACFL4W_03540 [Planctomycetota bacterium]
MIKRSDMLDDNSPDGIEVIQITDEEAIPSSHVYMEAQIFTPDSKRFVLHRQAHAHGPHHDQPGHQYLLCDIEDDCSLAPLTDEPQAIAPSVSPDGKTLYYIIDQSRSGRGSISLKRVDLDGTGREVLAVLDQGIPGDGRSPSSIYPLSTISPDGRRLATAAFLGDGQTEDAPFGLLVFDLESGDCRIALEGQSWCNIHPQYSRNPEAAHDIMVQENHGNQCDPEGKIVGLTGGNGADIHVIRDDGTNFRSFPWGRDGNEFAQGHQCWRGRSDKGITSTVTRDIEEEQLIESPAVDIDSHEGLKIPGGQRNDLSRDFTKPGFCHFATDIAGERFISDCGPFQNGGRLFYGCLPEAEGQPFSELKYLLSPGHAVDKTTHVHPFLSPDGKLGFFNSAESGILQAYMISGLGRL